ncbi:hypothetical protein JOE51_004152 [Bradyrhizobium japonicum]|uniref:Uncharacterized protein n=1 Tax=Bradyrhizobium diazoefficiens TaxID=1355477 RepID=A0A809Y479_9BRAD|nr:hypothetical protein [Bradyrhizobium japonicum]BCE33625.1 hypothetical protein XF2B_73940 [Bradyrhizobium diazoefficiens]BCF20702.1 hypothetical protein XF13B_73930 [Bradyrhizobium diazoefficiens]
MIEHDALRDRSVNEFDSIKAILIDPQMKSVARIDISKDARLSKYFGEKPRVAMKFPKGDVLFAGVQERAEAFTIGGSRPIPGSGLIVGRRIGPGERGPAHVRLADVVTMVRWTTVDAPPKPPATVRAIVIDPEQGLIEELLIAAHRLALLSLLGGEIGSYIRVPGNDHVLSPVPSPETPWCWRKDDLTFSSRSVIVGHDSGTDHFADVVTSVENLRTSVQFQAPGESCWMSYADRKAQGDQKPAA